MYGEHGESPGLVMRAQAQAEFAAGLRSIPPNEFEEEERERRCRAGHLWDEECPECE